MLAKKEEEPKYVFLPISRRYLRKEYCRKKAHSLLRKERISGMSEGQLAREIHSHALVYYFCHQTGLFPGLKQHADPVDLCDNGDTRFRRLAYLLFWLGSRLWPARRNVHRKSKQEKRSERA